MFDHVSIGVRDLARAKRFTTQRFTRLAMSASAKMPMRSDMGATKSVSGSAKPRGRCHPTRDQTSTSALPRPHVRPSMRSMSLPSPLAAPTMARRACARTMARTTTPPSWSTPMGIASRHISAVRCLGGIQAPLLTRAFHTRMSRPSTRQVAYPHSGLARKPQGSA
jgi:hypothetical protein